MNKIDIDRLHKVHLGELSGRRIGRTTWFASNLIGTSQLPNFKNKNIIVACTSMQRASHIVDVVCETCEMMEVEYKRLKRFELQINETRFHFEHEDEIRRVDLVFFTDVDDM